MRHSFRSVSALAVLCGLICVLTACGGAGVSAASFASPASLQLASGTLPAAALGQPYQASLTAQGGTSPYHWSIASGALPQGLSLNTSTGVVSGTPQSSGSYPLDIQVQDSSPAPQSQSTKTTVQVNSGMQVSSAPLPAGITGQSYSATLQASGGVAPYTWTLIKGSLPAGLALANSGQISGTPTATGGSSFTVEAHDSGHQKATATENLTVAIALSITNTSLPAGTVGQPYSASLQAFGGASPYTWTITAGTLPAGLTLASGGQISGTPSAASNTSITFQVADSGGQTQTASLPIAIAGAISPLSISTSSLPAGTTGQGYNATLSASGGTAPYSWQLASGSLPAGLTLSSAGQISGTPTASGSSSFAVAVSDSTGLKQTANLSIAVGLGLTVTNTSLPSGTVGQAYNASLQAFGGTSPYTWSVASGTLPAGLTLASWGQISGTPTAAANSTVTFKVADSNGLSQTAAFSIDIAASTAAPLAVTSSSLPAGTTGQSYSATLSASGGTAPYSWQLASGSLPAGLTLSAAGQISGTPTASGSSSFAVAVSDSAGQKQSANLSITVGMGITITNTSLPGGTVGQSYSASLQAFGGTSPYTWSVASGTLPAGLTLASWGQISGTPTAAATSTVTFKVADTSGLSQTATLSINVGASTATPLAISTNSLSGGQQGSAYSASLAASGGTTPYTWSISAGTLPAGLTLSSGGQISGTPSASGTSSFTVQVLDANNAQATQALSLAVQASSPSLTITTSSLPSATDGQAYTATLAASGGTTPYTWTVSAGSLPSGLILSSTGQISGTPGSSGTSTFTVQVTDAANNSQTAALSLVVGAAAATTTASGLDQYGGLLSVTSPEGGTGYFRVEKLGNRWVFITPEGHPMWMLGVFDVDSTTSIDDMGISYNSTILAKYGSMQQWGIQTARRLKAWGFNTAAEYANDWVVPLSYWGTRNTTSPIPFVQMLRPAYYSMIDQNNLAPQPMKDLINGLDSEYTDYRGGNTPDVFDPNFATYADAFVQQNTNTALATSPWLIGTAIDDGDNLLGFGPGPDLPTNPGGHEGPNIGWVALCTNFQQTSNSRYSLTYSDTKVYTKYALQQFLEQKYGTIQNLNAAWGSNYTTFDDNGGYGMGTGLLDEDGRNPWVGNDDIAMSTANPAVKTDLNAFLRVYADKFFQIETAAVRKYRPNQLVFGPATLNGWNGISRQQILASAAQYCDVVQASVADQQVYEMTLQATGDKPLVSWEGETANADSDLWRYPDPDSSRASTTQSARGAAYQQKLLQDLNMAAASTDGALAGSQNIAGMKFWAWCDSWGEKTNWGLVSFLDNAYDGKEAIVASGTDPWGYTTGGEEKNYDDFIDAVKSTNEQITSSLSSLP